LQASVGVFFGQQLVLSGVEVLVLVQLARLVVLTLHVSSGVVTLVVEEALGDTSAAVAVDDTVVVVVAGPGEAGTGPSHLHPEVVGHLCLLAMLVFSVELSSPAV
jgi:hypothetical protein